MKKLSLRALLMTAMLVTSLAAFIYLSSAGDVHVLSKQESIVIDSTGQESYRQLDVEILKHLIEQGKDKLPLISSQSSETNVIE